MAITWGAWTGSHWSDFRVGIELSVSGTTITAKYYVGCRGAASDNQTLHRTGAITGTTSYFCSIPSGGGTQHITTKTRTGSRGTTYTFAASISGVYSGVTPTVSNVKITVPAIAPSTPSQSAHSNITSTGVRVNYSISSDGGSPIIRTQVRRATNSGMTSGLVSRYDTSGFTSYSGHNDLSPGTKYWTDVRAENSVGWSSRSSTRSFTTLAVVPTIGTAASATNITRNSAVIPTPQVLNNGGEAPSNVRHQYNTVASADGATTVTRGSYSSTTLSGLTALTEYHYRSAVWNSAGWSDYSAWRTFTTLDDAPDDVAPPDFSEITDDSFRMDWIAPNMNGATFVTYRYEVSELDTFVGLVASGTTTDLFAVIADLTPGTTYYVRVRAEATPNNGGWGEDSVTTTGITPESGLRVYTFIGGVLKQGQLYTFVNGERKSVRPMYAHDGVLETE